MENKVTIFGLTEEQIKEKKPIFTPEERKIKLQEANASTLNRIYDVNSIWLWNKPGFFPFEFPVSNISRMQGLKIKYKNNICIPEEIIGTPWILKILEINGMKRSYIVIRSDGKYSFTASFFQWLIKSRKEFVFSNLQCKECAEEFFNLFQEEKPIYKHIKKSINKMCSSCSKKFNKEYFVYSLTNPLFNLLFNLFVKKLKLTKGNSSNV